jgi:quercetin dioxygenase-like cupin family protein
MNQPQHPAGLDLGKNYISTHTLDGGSIFLPDTQISSTPQYKTIPHTKSTFADLHQTPSIPASLTRQSANNDIVSTISLINDNKLPATVPPTGVRFCRTDTPPGGISPMHRTLSVDYATVISGSIELILESGESRILKAGDTIVQRATMHQWKNPSATEWCRMSVVMMPIEEFVVNGKKLEQEFRIPGKAL